MSDLKFCPHGFPPRTACLHCTNEVASEREARQAAEAQAARLTRVAEDLGRARDEEHAALVSVMERLDAATQRAEEAERRIAEAEAACDMPLGHIATTLHAHRNTAQEDHEYAERAEKERDAARAEAEALRRVIAVAANAARGEGLDAIGPEARCALAAIAMHLDRALASAGQTTDAPRSPAADAKEGNRGT